MISYQKALNYFKAAQLASKDSRWSDKERVALSRISDNKGTQRLFSSGRIFSHSGESFLFHYASSGVNIGKVG